MTPKAFIIDNGTNYLPQLQSYVTGCKYQVIGTQTYDGSPIVVPEGTDLVVLSGGRERSVVEHPKHYAAYRDFLGSTDAAVLGICIGFQLMAYWGGGELVRNTKYRKGLRTFNFGGEQHSVYAYHVWSIRGLPVGYESRCDSKLGCEMAVHTTLPLGGVQFHPEITQPENEGWLVGLKLMRELQTRRAALKHATL